MVSICQVMLQDHVTKGWSNFFVWKLLKVSHHPTTFDYPRHYSMGDIMVLVCHVTSQDHVIKISYDFIVRSLSR